VSSGFGRVINKGSMEASTSSPTIRVEIYNQTYNIRSDGDTEYIIQLAEFVDSRMREISSGTLTVDPRRTAHRRRATPPEEHARTGRLATRRAQRRVCGDA
jgi:hypothetical protein